MRFVVGWNLCNGLRIIAIALHFTHPIYKAQYNVSYKCSFHILIWNFFQTPVYVNKLNKTWKNKFNQTVNNIFHAAEYTANERPCMFLDLI